MRRDDGGRVLICRSHASGWNGWMTRPSGVMISGRMSSFIVASRRLGNSAVVIENKIKTPPGNGGVGGTMYNLRKMDHKTLG